MAYGQIIEISGLCWDMDFFLVWHWISNFDSVFSELFIKNVDVDITSFQLADDTKVGGVFNGEDILTHIEIFEWPVKTGAV